MENEEMITLQEATERYHLSRDGIYYHVRKGNIKTYKRVGDKKAYVSVPELEKLLEFRVSTDYTKDSGK
jgi:hypothetical protein